MKRTLLIIACVVVIGCLLVLVMGGLQYHRFVRYVAMKVAPPQSNDDPFMPALFLELAPIAHHTVVPGLLDTHIEPDGEATLELGTKGFESYGYASVRTFTIEELSIKTRDDFWVPLILRNKPVAVAIHHDGYGQSQDTLGTVHGEQVEIRCSGHAVSESGKSRACL